MRGKRAAAKFWALGRSFTFRLPLPRPLSRLEDLGRGHSFGERIPLNCRTFSGLLQNLAFAFLAVFIRLLSSGGSPDALRGALQDISSDLAKQIDRLTASILLNARFEVRSSMRGAPAPAGGV